MTAWLRVMAEEVVRPAGLWVHLEDRASRFADAMLVGWRGAESR